MQDLFRMDFNEFFLLKKASLTIEVSNQDMNVFNIEF